MYPTLLELGDIRFHAYTVMMTLAFLVGTLGPNWLNNRRANPYPVSPAGGIWIFFAGMAGAKLYWVLQYGDASHWRYLQFLISGGLVFFGGLIGGILGGIAYLKYVKAPVVPVADMVAPFMALAHALGRIGCFLNGCCWGALMRGHFPWGVSYPRSTHGPYRAQIREGLISASETHSLPVHPTQLYETFGLMVMFVLLLIIYKRHKRTGVVALSYLLMYGALRFVTEAFRGESGRPVGDLTVSQMVGLGMFVGSALLFLVLGRTIWRKPLPALQADDDDTADGEESCVSDTDTPEEIQTT